MIFAFLQDSHICVKFSIRILRSFENKNYSTYHVRISLPQALSLIENAHLQNEEDEMLWRDNLKKLYLNLSICCLKQAKSPRAITYCRKVLELQPNNAKAFFRLGAGLYIVLSVCIPHTDIHTNTHTRTHTHAHTHAHTHTIHTHTHTHTHTHIYTHTYITILSLLQAYMQLAEFNKSRDYLLKAGRLAPSNEDIRQELRKLDR